MMCDTDLADGRLEEDTVSEGDSENLAPTRLVLVRSALVAEFDIDKGSSITCCKHWNGTKVVDHEVKTLKGAPLDDFAEIMLPDGTHKRNEDWSVAILNRNRPLNRNIFCGVESMQNRTKIERNNIFEADVLDWDDFARKWSPRKQKVKCLVSKESSAASDVQIIFDWDGEGVVPTDSDCRVLINETTVMHEVTPAFLALKSKDGRWMGFAFANSQELGLFKQRLFERIVKDDEDIESDQEFLFSIAINRLDASVRRGAQIKAIGIITKHRFFRIFEPLMRSALESCFGESENVGNVDQKVNPIDSRESNSTEDHVADKHASKLSVENGGQAPGDLINVNSATATATATVTAANTTATATGRVLENLLQQLNGAVVKLNPTTSSRGDTFLPMTSLYPVELRRMIRRRALDRHMQQLDLGTTRAEVRDGSTINDSFYGDALSESVLPQVGTVEFFSEGCVREHFATIELTREPEEADKANLIELVKIFGSSTAAIWRAILEERRILFIGENASAGLLGTAVLSACTLTLPLQNQLSRAFPYVNLQHVDQLLAAPGFIAGTSNPIFKTHPSWWDILCDLDSGEVCVSPIIQLFENESSSSHPAHPARGSSAAGGAKGNAWIQVSDKYIDRNLGDALQAALTDSLGEEWLRNCCFSITSSVLLAAQANYEALLKDSSRSVADTSRESGHASNPSANPSTSETLVTHKLKLWGDFGVAQRMWNNRPVAHSRTVAQILPRLIRSSPFHVYEMASAARLYIIKRWAGHEFQNFTGSYGKDEARAHASKRRMLPEGAHHSMTDEPPQHDLSAIVRQLQTLTDDPSGIKYGLTLSTLKEHLDQRGPGALLQLVSLMTADEGGLHALAIGLLHPQSEVKNLALDLIKDIQEVPAARHSVSSLNPLLFSMIKEHSKHGFGPDS